MRYPIAVVIAVAAGSSAHADIAVTFGRGGALAGWKRIDGAGTLEVKDGASVQASPAIWSRGVTLDPGQGWAIEARFAIGYDANGGARIAASDGRQSASFKREVHTLVLDDKAASDDADDRPHVYRLEVLGGHHRLLIDGKLVLENDHEIGAFDNDPDPPHVELGGEPGDDSIPVTRWLALKIENAPRGLVKGDAAYAPLVRFTGPYAPWLQRIAGDVPERALELSRLRLSEDARTCVAYAIVRSAGGALPEHFRRDEWLPQPSTAQAKRSDRRLPISDPPPPRKCDPARPCDCGRCPHAESFQDHARDSLRAALDAQTGDEARRAIDDAASWVLFSSRVQSNNQPNGSPAPPVPVPADAREIPATSVSWTEDTVKPLLDELSVVSRRPRACR